MKNKVSAETQEQALKVAKANQRPGQTKEQTKLIAQGIEKGIAEYKKQHSKKVRELDKQRKQKVKHQQIKNDELEPEDISSNSHNQSAVNLLPWLLLGLSWLGFVLYYFLK